MKINLRLTHENETVNPSLTYLLTHTLMLQHRAKLIISNKNVLKIKSDQVTLDTLIKFLFEIIKNLSKVQSYMLNKIPTTFLVMVNHYFRESINMKVQEFRINNR